MTTSTRPLAGTPGPHPGLAGDIKFHALEFLLVFLILFIPLRSILDAANFTIFTARDLDRAQLLAAGHLILFGPEASGGGHLPGSLYYFMLAIPLKLGLGWKAVWELQFAMAAAGFSLLWLFIRLRLGAFPAYYAIFCAAFFNSNIFFFAYNASFLPLFAIVSLTSLCAAFDETSERRGLAWTIFCLSCGFGLQFHLSIIPLLLAGPSIQLLAGRLRLKPLSGRAFVAGLGVLAATLLPYGIWTASVHFGKPIGQPALPFTGTVPGDGVTTAAKLWGILRYYVAYYAAAWPVIPARALANRTLELVPLEAIVPLLFLYLSGRGKKVSAAPDASLSAGAGFAGTCVKILSVSTALTFFPYLMALALSPSRYAVISRLSLDFLACAILAGRQDRLRPDRFYPVVIGTLAALALIWHIALPSAEPAARFQFAPYYVLFQAATGLLLALLARRNEGTGTSRTLPAMALILPFFLSSLLGANIKGHLFQFDASKDLEAMSRIVLSQTGWTYADARLRLFYINVHVETTPAYVYRAVEAAGVSPSRTGSGLKRIDGYFVVLLRENSLNRYGDSIKELMLTLDIPPILKEGLISGGIALGIPAKCGRIFLVPYEVTDTQRFPPYFHNSSEGYSLTGPEPPLRSEHGSRTFRFTFNDCPGHREWCDIMADVRTKRQPGGRWLAQVVISGEPLAQVSNGVNLQWNQVLEHPYFTATCGGKSLRIPLAGSLGMHQDRNRSMNESLLSPYERIFNFECRGGLKKVSVGYVAAEAYYLTRKIDGLPGREISANADINASFPR